MDGQVVLVTGASGFVGQHLLTRLVAAGTRVVAMHQRTLAPATLAKFGSNVTWRQADISRDDLVGPIGGVHTVFHLAAHATVSERSSEVERMQRVNVLGTRRLAAASRECGVRRFVFVSSIAACEGSASPEVTEDDGQPTSSYGRFKRAAENEALALAGPQFGVTVLRPTALFGEEHRGSVYELVRAIHAGRFVLIGDGSNCTNFYYVGDFVDVLLAAADDPRAIGQTFIASDEPRALGSLVNDIGAILRRSQPVRRIPAWLGYALGGTLDAVATVTGRTLPLSVRRVRAMTRDVRYRSDRLERVLGLTPQCGVVAGLRRSIEWYRTAGLL